MIDLDDVQFLGTAGFGILVAANTRALREQVTLVLVCSTPLVLRPIGLFGLMFAISASADNALTKSVQQTSHTDMSCHIPVSQWSSRA